MDHSTFRVEAHRMVDRMADYLEQVAQYPVLSQVNPGDIKKALPASAPCSAEGMDAIMADFEKIIMPGITHWESPYFFGYFPASKSAPSILAEMLTATLGVQGMLWLTSPAATELEEQMMQWLLQMMDLPLEWKGVIQDTASTATLTALLCARERASRWQINERGFAGNERFTVYCSDQVHSSIDKDVKIAGIGIQNLRKIATDRDYAMDATALRLQIINDLAEGYQPLCVISALGTTGSTAIDPIEEISAICREFGIWHHIDAAYAGTALILPECRYIAKGAEHADSFVFNPHKWMFVNFDCSVYFVKDPSLLIHTFSITPEYLKTVADDEVTNYRDWHIQLGRRFRALKLWFVIRSFGLEGLQAKIRLHNEMGQWLKTKVEEHEEFELLAPVPLNLVCFRSKPKHLQTTDELNKWNADLLSRINNGGRMFLSHTKLDDQYVLRLVPGNDQVRMHHVQQAWEWILEAVTEMKRQGS
jgi:aromatic-L-amino-acid decarboxylase